MSDGSRRCVEAAPCGPQRHSSQPTWPHSTRSIGADTQGHVLTPRHPVLPADRPGCGKEPVVVLWWPQGGSSGRRRRSLSEGQLSLDAAPLPQGWAPSPPGGRHRAGVPEAGCGSGSPPRPDDGPACRERRGAPDLSGGLPSGSPARRPQPAAAAAATSAAHSAAAADSVPADGYTPSSSAPLMGPQGAAGVRRTSAAGVCRTSAVGVCRTPAAGVCRTAAAAAAEIQRPAPPGSCGEMAGSSRRSRSSSGSRGGGASPGRAGAYSAEDGGSGSPLLTCIAPTPASTSTYRSQPTDRHAAAGGSRSSCGTAAAAAAPPVSELSAAAGPLLDSPPQFLGVFTALSPRCPSASLGAHSPSAVSPHAVLHEGHCPPAPASTASITAALSRAIMCAGTHSSASLVSGFGVVVSDLRGDSEEQHGALTFQQHPYEYLDMTAGRRPWGRRPGEAPDRPVGFSPVGAACVSSGSLPLPVPLAAAAAREPLAAAAAAAAARLSGAGGSRAAGVHRSSSTGSTGVMSGPAGPVSLTRQRSRPRAPSVSAAQVELEGEGAAGRSAASPRSSRLRRAATQLPPQVPTSASDAASSTPLSTSSSLCGAASAAGGGSSSRSRKLRMLAGVAASNVAAAGSSASSTTARRETNESRLPSSSSPGPAGAGAAVIAPRAAPAAAGGGGGGPLTSSGVEPQALRLISCTLRASDIKRAPGARSGRVCTADELGRLLLSEAGGAATKLLLTRAAGGTAELPPPASKSSRGVFPPIAEDDLGLSDGGLAASAHNEARGRLQGPRIACGCVVM